MIETIAILISLLVMSIGATGFWFLKSLRKKNTITQLKQRIAELQKEIVALESENSRLKKTISGLQFENSALKAENLELKRPKGAVQIVRVGRRDRDVLM